MSHSVAADQIMTDAHVKPPSASGIVPTLQNIVATVNLDCRLDLKTIALHARNAEYNPKRFAAVIMRIREPKTTALIFASGKMVVTGAKSEEMSKLAARKYARIIQKLGFQAKFTDFKIQNIVGSCDVKFPIRLEGLALNHGSFCSYEPELFPGLIYRMLRPKIVLLIFVSGKIVLTGAKVRDEIYAAFENIFPVLTGMYILEVIKHLLADTRLVSFALQNSVNRKINILSSLHETLQTQWTPIVPSIIEGDRRIEQTLNPLKWAGSGTVDVFPPFCQPETLVGRWQCTKFYLLGVSSYSIKYNLAIYAIVSKQNAYLMIY